MKKLSLFLFITLIFGLSSFAQSGWNWPKDEPLLSQAKEKQAFYKLQLAQNKYSETLTTLHWLFKNNPELNPSIYIHGVKCVKEVLNTEISKERKIVLQDSLLWMFDQRIKYFDNKNVSLDKKTYEAFKIFYRKPSKFKMLADLFASTYEKNGVDVGNYNLNTYMMLAVNYHKSKPEEMPAEKVLEIYNLISETIEKKRANGGNATRLDKEQEKTDKFLTAVKEILSCDFIEKSLVPKLKENPEDVETANKIFKYSLKAKCTDKPYFLQASELVFKSKPSYDLAKALANKYVSSNEIDIAEKFQNKAFEMASTNDEKYEALIGKAKIASKRGKKSAARSFAREAIGLKPNNSEPYNLIGNLYFYSFNTCKQEKSRVLDRATYIAAYNMYSKAGNKSQMSVCKAQFPSIEEIFGEGYAEGQSVNIGCWINESVKLMRR